jgi:hypothetical protein
MPPTLLRKGGFHGSGLNVINPSVFKVLRPALLQKVFSLKIF